MVKFEEKSVGYLVAEKQKKKKKKPAPKKKPYCKE